MAKIRVEKLHKAFGDFVAVRESTLTVESGEFFCLLGPSGCGKTTTLRMIAGLELPTSGSIFLDSDDVSFKRAAQRDIAFVFQFFALYPHMSVRQNIAFPLKSQGVRRTERKQRVAEAAKTLQIGHLLDRSRFWPLFRRPAEGRARTRHRSEAEGVPDGRAARGARHRAPRGDDRRIARPSQPPQRDDDLCHARSARGDGDGGPDRGDESRRRWSRSDLRARSMTRPSSVFVADFIGSPPMNFLTFHASLEKGAGCVKFGKSDVRRAEPSTRASARRELVLGVRPEAVQFSDFERFSRRRFSARNIWARRRSSP